MSNAEKLQALENLIIYMKKWVLPYMDHEINIDNTGYAKLKSIGEVVYTRLPTGETMGKVKEVEFIFYNNGKSKKCGGFGIDRPFTSTGKYRNIFDGDLEIVEEMESIPQINDWMAKLRLLGLK